MARRRSLKSISVPITLGAITVPLSAALLVGWSVLIGKNIAESEDIAGNVWLLVLGAISFLVIIVVLVLFSIYLAREILEVRRQDSFIDSVTHELKSPLASLKLCLETLGREDIALDQREQLRKMMLHDVDRLTSFIEDVLQASRLAYDVTAMDAAEIDLEILVRACAAAVCSRHHISTERVKVEVPPDLVVSSDRAALELIVKNLIDNAVKYSDGEVDVTVHADLDRKGRTIIEVTDRGVGIPQKQLKRIFHRFYRVEQETVQRRKGTGLGLFVVSALLRNLGGSIVALSEGPGKGATMRVTLHGGNRQPRIGPQMPPPEPSTEGTEGEEEVVT